MSSQNALSLTLLSPRKLFPLPWDPVPASSFPSLRVCTPLPLIYIMTCLYFSLHPRRVTLEHHFIHTLITTVTTWHLHYLHTALNYSCPCLVFHRLWVPCSWGLQLYLALVHCLVYRTVSKLFVKGKILIRQYPDIFWASQEGIIELGFPGFGTCHFQLTPRYLKEELLFLFFTVSISPVIWYFITWADYKTLANESELYLGKNTNALF